MKKAFIVSGILVVILGLAVFLYMQDVENSKLTVNEQATETPAIGQEIENQGQGHINPGTLQPYNSNPPTSGPHYAQAANWGVYSNPLEDEQAVHNLEHGGIWISYKDIDEETKTLLENIAKANRGSVIMSPRPNNDSKIAIASWTRLEKLESYDEAKILEFIRANKNKSPEPLAQ